MEATQIGYARSEVNGLDPIYYLFDTDELVFESSELGPYCIQSLDGDIKPIATPMPRDVAEVLGNVFLTKFKDSDMIILCNLGYIVMKDGEAEYYNMDLSGPYKTSSYDDGEEYLGEEYEVIG